MKNNIITDKKALQILRDTTPEKRNTEKYQTSLNLAIEALNEKVNPPAHWIFSGDDEDYDGYYINCSHCGVQRKAYDRDCELDIPIACPHCGISINREAWKVNDIARTVANAGESENHEKLFRVCVIHDNGTIKRPYILTVRTATEKAAKQIALSQVATKWLHRNKVGNDLYVDCVEEVE